MSGRSIDVAVKAIRTYTAERDNDANSEKKIRREIITWLNLDHNNVVPLFGTTMNFGRLPAMVCPWLENGSLTFYLERPNSIFTITHRLSLVIDVAVGLQYLHSRSVVHGDLSGSNVLVDGEGRACISDFGLSTLLTGLGRSSCATFYPYPGTQRWTAPELLEFRGRDGDDAPLNISPSPRGDVYSFGRVMLQVCPSSTTFALAR
ncbi:hypothetical protein PAXRUDRAFT_300969 [Paxillus rubicundulus Ve08.2h10]|uniref:Protein kinase domain-containing protein n=1 Tax=Paxillus rubicundulus Ve08.2h10 TaxID=930991 RepID=A0A0D0CU79_9AGAM|nr:hypothetical protein PAXRUDRAFT_300969 [Paxillus rubicundulus Ve08.2h10]